MKDIETGAIIPISGMSISGISDSDLEAAFYAVVSQHKEAVLSISKSMQEADNAYQKYLDENYEPLEEEAKKDRAALNKAEKNIAEQFASLKAAYEKPLQPIEVNIKSIRNAIKTASGIVDGAVKSYEEKQKGKKREQIETYWKAGKFDLVPLEKVFDSRWLNKGYKLENIIEEIDGIIEKIHSDIKTLESIAEYGLIAKSEYLDTLDMGAAMRKAEMMKENALRLAREKAEREQREIQAQVKANSVQEFKEERIAAEDKKIQSMVNKALNIEPALPDNKPELFEETLRFKYTKEQGRGLKEYMTKNGIAYKKVENEAAYGWQ